MKYLIALIAALSIAGCSTPRPDLVQHAGAGLIVSAVVTEYTGDPWMGCAASLFAGVAKEYYDSFTHAPDGADILATALGGCVLTINF